MALTNAERQRHYRRRAFGADGTLTRLTTPLSTEAAAALNRLAHGYGRTKRHAVEKALMLTDAAIINRLPEPDKRAYQTGTLAKGALQDALRRHEPAPKNQQERASNPEHQRLFTIPAPLCSNEGALTVPELPAQQAITGDPEIDACLWLAQVCKTARHPGVLDKVLVAAQRITTPAKEIEQRYVDWLKQQPGVHPMRVIFASFDMANIEEKVAKARERIVVYNEGAAIFGSYQQALMPTPPEQMIERTVGELPGGDDDLLYRWTQEQRAELFARSVNPTTLTEVAAELHYWRWLHDIRWKLQQTEAPDEDSPDDPPEISARRDWVEGLLCELPPQSPAEALQIGEAVRHGLVETGSVDDWKTQAAILEHLLRQAVEQC
ncbi:MAG: hypothetical protein VBE63_18060 [Lamprobacter sp.]|uniref:hypothetical protein n=1 Tax=Lamprobacter sp. TaxID=3100796 RepID=UPI002B25FE51|nr:hypothetical protein [Lamprobacter sp.]MEA3641821.1 hypothetical protein [Lamprobacter sp.]